MAKNRCECGGPTTTIHYDGDGRKCLPTLRMDGTELNRQGRSDSQTRELDVDRDDKR